MTTNGQTIPADEVRHLMEEYDKGNIDDMYEALEPLLPAPRIRHILNAEGNQS